MGSTYRNDNVKEDGAQFNGTCGSMEEKRGHHNYSSNTAEGRSKQFNGDTEASISRIAFESANKEAKRDP